jgi:catechol 2,3-dioxygenase-like lactoylglutathione lyase family enzyme
MWSGFGGLVIGVRDLAAAEAGYAALLGRPPAWRALAAGEGCLGSGFVVGNALLELRAPAGEGVEARALGGWLEARGEGLHAVVLASDDPAASVRALGTGTIEGGGAPPPGGVRAASPFASALRIAESATRGIPVLVAAAASLPPRTASFGGASVAALDHVVVATRDPDAARAVWGGTLGLRLALDRRFEARGLRILFFRLGGVTVEVTGPLRDPEPDAASAVGARSRGEPEARRSGSGKPSRDRVGRALPGPGPDGFLGAAWRVGDVDAARERVAAAGFDVSDVRAGHKPGTRVCTVRGGTHGVATLLIGPDPAGAAGPGSATLPPS